MFDPKSDDSELTARLVPLVPVTGRVSFPDGHPAAGIEVLAAGAGYQFDSFSGTARTAEDGTFKIEVYPNQYYLVVPSSKEWAAPGRTQVVLEAPVEQIDFTLDPARRVYGRVTMGTDRKPLAEHFLVLYQNIGNRYYELPEDQRLLNPTDSHSAIYPVVGRTLYTDDEGSFEFFVGTGDYYIIGPKNSETPKFEITDEKTLEINLHTPQPDSVEIAGRFVLKDDPSQGVAEALVEGVPMQSRMRDLEAVTNSRGRLRAERGLSEMVVFATSPDRRLAGIVKIEAESTAVTIPIGPTASARGRLVDANGEPLAGRQIDYGVHIVYSGGSFNNRFGSSTTTDATGAFTLSDLIVGWEYTLDVSEHVNNFETATVGN